MCRSCRCYVLEVLVWKLLWEALGGSCIKILQDPLQQQQVLVWRSCELLLRALAWRSCRGLLQVLVRSSCGEPSEMLSGPLHDLVQVLERRSWRGPGEILSVSLHDLVQVLVRRSCGDPAEILLKRSLHSDIEDSLRWCLSESSSGMLIESSCMKILWAPIYRSI